MDIFGVSVLAFTAACGGGILRALIMDVGVPSFFKLHDYRTCDAVVLFVFIMPGLFYFRWVFVVLDAIGLSFFAVDAGIKAINQKYTFVQFVFVAVITAVGGGILRDILAQRVPVIFGGTYMLGRICRGHMHVVPLSDRRRKGSHEARTRNDFLHTDHLSIF
jgi:uncharacterized membrane protein YeiH